MKLRVTVFHILFLLLLVMPAQAAIITYSAVLNGANEVPPVASSATGTASVRLDDTAFTLQVNVTFSGLTGGAATAAHIHCCAAAGVSAGVAVGFTGFPAATSGTFSNTYNLNDSAIYNASFLSASGGTTVGARTALINALLIGRTYVNIHNATFPGGEIRGQLIPEPSTYMLFALGLGMIAVVRRRRPVR